MAPVIESGPCVRSLQMDYDDEVAYHGAQALYDLARTGDDRPFMLTVSFTSTVSDPTGTKLLAATYVGVDQTTPINDNGIATMTTIGSM